MRKVKGGERGREGRREQEKGRWVNTSASMGLIELCCG
jgi:hypothetical protein